MKRFITTIIAFAVPLFLSACTPSETTFKSQIPFTRPAIEDSEIVTGSAVEDMNEGDDLTDSVNLDVPFYAQAPDGDWGMPWQEACEEASITLAYYYAAEKPLSKEQFKTDVLALVEWQKEYFGDYIHTTIDQTAEMMKAYFDFDDFSIVENPSIDDLKKHLAKGHVIVAPFAGRQLGNPFYSGEGPYYHVMVIKGYDEKNFITNDVGTRRGENFIYPYDTLMNALHDYHDTDMRLGSKKVIVFSL